MAGASRPICRTSPTIPTMVTHGHVGIGVADLEALPDGVLPRPVLPRHGLVDDGDRPRLGAVRPLDEAPLPQRDAQRPQEVGAHLPVVRVVGEAGLGALQALGDEAARAALPLEGHGRAVARGDDSRQVRHALQHLFVEGGAPRQARRTSGTAGRCGGSAALRAGGPGRRSACGRGSGPGGPRPRAAPGWRRSRPRPGRCAASADPRPWTSRPPWRKARFTSIRAVCRAGARPNRSPGREREDEGAHEGPGVEGRDAAESARPGGTSCSRKRERPDGDEESRQHAERRESRTLSVSSWRTMRPGAAPRAVRTAISRARDAARARRRPARLAQAIRSTATIASDRMSSGRRASPVSCSRRGST